MSLRDTFDNVINQLKKRKEKSKNYYSTVFYDNDLMYEINNDEINNADNNEMDNSEIDNNSELCDNNDKKEDEDKNEHNCNDSAAFNEEDHSEEKKKIMNN